MCNSFKSYIKNGSLYIYVKGQFRMEYADLNYDTADLILSVELRVKFLLMSWASYGFSVKLVAQYRLYQVSSGCPLYHLIRMAPNLERGAAVARRLDKYEPFNSREIFSFLFLVFWAPELFKYEPLKTAVYSVF